MSFNARYFDLNIGFYSVSIDHFLRSLKTFFIKICNRLNIDFQFINLDDQKVLLRIELAKISTFAVSIDIFLYKYIELN